MAGIGDYSVLMDTPYSFMGAINPLDGTNSGLAQPLPTGLPDIMSAPTTINPGATPIGFNLGTLGAGISGLSALGNMWMGFKAQKQAKKQFKFAKQMARINLANQIKSYNTALADRARSRAVMEGQTPEQAQAYFDSNSLKQLPGQSSGGFGGGSYSASLSPTGSSSVGTSLGSISANSGSIRARLAARANRDDETNG